MLYTIKIEQTFDYPNRMKYNADTGTFIDEGAPSLSYQRGVRWPYGWLTESGAPPRAHLDAYLVSTRRYALGDEERVRVIGVFCRNDGDNKLVTVPLDSPVEDFSRLPAEIKEDFHRLYPREAPGEGWFGRARAEEIINAYFEKV